MSGKSRGRIGMILETGFPPDARVEREALALSEAGYDVYLLCRKTSASLPDEETYRGIRIIRVDPETVQSQWRIPGTPWTIKTRILYRGLFRSLLKRLTATEIDWKPLIRRFIEQFGIEMLHVHDLKLLNTALSVRTNGHSNIKVIADLHENYPALVGRVTGLRKGKFRGLAKQRWWEKIERISLPKANGVIVVVEEARDRILRYPNIPVEKVAIVRNVVDSEKFLTSDIARLPSEEEQRFEGRFVLCYVGFINSMHRGIHTVLEALPIIIERIPNLLFVGAGSVRNDYLNNTLVPILEKHHLHPYVHLTGFLDETQFVPYIQQSTICICPHLQTPLTDTTFPNKVFLYSLFKKPMVVSSCLPLARYVNDTQSGVIFTSDDPQDLAKRVLQLYDDPALRERLGENGYASVISRYCWEKEKQHLLDAYQRL